MGERLRRNPRLERLRHNVPVWYVPLHLGVSIGLLGGLSLALLGFLPNEKTHWSSWVAAISAVLLAEFAEYALHRWPMHKRRNWSRAFFHAHTIEHHRYFTHTTMGISSLKDVTFIISSIPVLIFSLALIGLVVWGFAATMGLEAGLLTGSFLGLTGALKQVLHLSFHFPDSWYKYPVLRSRLFYWMREHHVIHHDPHMMTKWNFNIGIPLFDALFGTLTWEHRKK